MNSAKISIITATYNSLPYIRETYDSIVQQTYKNWEWVVTDDCSNDGTYEYLLELAASNEKIKISRNEHNSGAAVSRNKSLSAASGDFIAFIDSDDLWTTNKLELQLSVMLNKKHDFTFTAYELINDKSQSLNKVVDSKQINAVDYQDMLKKQATLGCSTVMLRKAAFSDLSMPLLLTGQDYALWLKLLKMGCCAYPINEVLMKYRVLPNSISRNKYKKAKRQWQIYRELEKLSLLKCCVCFGFYAWRAVFRK
uniref:glycosyltransferase family 2 protein n=1 Tax=Pantoea sp. IMH TaxID=1267600 RepID=UPI0004699D0F|nr:glycosyltransferase [Pantoea sp. IMH]